MTLNANITDLDHMS